MNEPSETAFVTGATGFVGRELVRRLVESHPDLHLIALVRASDDISLAGRHATLIKELPPAQAARVTVLRGDMVAPRLGLAERDWNDVVDRVDRVLHCAASIRFDLPLEVARRENVESTRTVLSLCRTLRARGRLARLDHVSTAFVAGRRAGVVGEDELFVGQPFRNTYEQTKLEAEVLCRSARDELPVVIHRPSIVVGHQATGRTSTYKAVYGPMRLLIGAYDTCPRVLNRLVPLPLAGDLRVDLVPVDHVASAIATLWLRGDAIGRCYHLAAGAEGAATVRELANLTCDHLGTPRVRCAAPGRGLRTVGRLVSRPLRAVAPRALAIASILFDYGAGMPIFDTTAARAAGVGAPAVTRYFGRILSFALSDDFGRARDARSNAIREDRGDNEFCVSAARTRNVVMASNSRKRACSESSGGGAGRSGSRSRSSGTICATYGVAAPKSDARSAPAPASR